MPGVAVEPRRVAGRKCARSWKILPTVDSDPEYPDAARCPGVARIGSDAQSHGVANTDTGSPDDAVWDILIQKIFLVKIVGYDR